ncbi:hypothetical protein D3C71_2002000 [compost metagenome]
MKNALAGDGAFPPGASNTTRPENATAMPSTTRARSFSPFLQPKVNMVSCTAPNKINAPTPASSCT